MTPPATVGRYRILERLGAGAMGEVYLAEDPQIERQVAIKTVRLANVDESEIQNRRDRLLREAKAVGRLVHPHVVTLFDAGEENGVLFLALEYVPGTDLRDRMKSPPPLTVREVLALVKQTASALGVAHRQGIVHRDVKPGNILLNERGEAKISDFGIAKVQDQISDLTASGAIIGTPFYMSPEQIRGETIDGRADLFSLGAVLFELLHGARPFDGDTITTVVYQILHHDPLPSAREDLPPALARLLRWMLAKDLSERVPTAEKVVEAISDLERSLPATLLDAAAMGAPLPRAGEQPAPPPPALTPPPPPAPPPPEPPSSSTREAAASPGESGPPAAPISPARAVAAKPRIHPAAIAVLGCAGILAISALVALVFVAPRVREMLRDATGEVSSQVSSEVAAATSSEATTASSSLGEPDVEASAPVAEADRTEAGSEPASTATPGSRESEQEAGTASASAPAEAPQRATRAGATPQQPRTPPSSPSSSGPSTNARAARLDSPPPARGAPPAARGAEAEAPVETTSPDTVSPEVTASPESVDIPWQSELETGPEITLMVVPEDSYVQLRGPGDTRFTSIGQARDYDVRRKRAQPFRMPGTGLFYLRLRREGYPDHVVRLRVSGSMTGVTPVSVRLGAGAVRQLPQAITVKQGVTFSGGDDNARVLVDGTPRGTIGRFRARALRLGRGRHRLVIEDGGDRLEMLVVVSPGARLRNGVIQIPDR